MTPTNTLPVNEIICGDCLEVMKDWPDNLRCRIITDPVWPDTVIWPDIDAEKLFARAAKEICRFAQTVVVILGCDTAPNMLNSIKLPYMRTCWLRYACPHYKGRILYTSDVAYVYGEKPSVIKGRFVLGGEYVKTDARAEKFQHPCYRSLQHIVWLVKTFTDVNDLVVDPFNGSGTTCVAAKMLGRNYIGIDISEEYCEIARQRIKAVETGVPVKEQNAGQMPLFAEQK